MTRAPFNVLVFPYRVTAEGEIEYAVFRRADAGWWQAIAGGGENKETPLEAARREAHEEAGISPELPFLALDSVSTIPVEHVRGFLWGYDVLVIPQHCFGVDVRHRRLSLSQEHTEFRWTDYDSALHLLKWDSNRNALWELNLRLKRRLSN